MKKLNNHGWGMLVFLIFVLLFLLVLFITAGRITGVKNTIENQIQEEE